MTRKPHLNAHNYKINMNHNPNQELSEKLAPIGAIALLIIIILALFV